jgi:hypothetical protein
MDLYRSRLDEMRANYGEYREPQAAADCARYLHGLTTEGLLELRYTDRRRIHNLKYFTWVEQQGRTHAELVAQWVDPAYWSGVQGQVSAIDERIQAFNERVGLLEAV